VDNESSLGDAMTPNKRNRERFALGQTPLEAYAEKTVDELERTQKMQAELDKYGHKTLCGGTAWTGADLARFFLDQQKKKHPKRRA
jgi:hypothetical protein